MRSHASPSAPATAARSASVAPGAKKGARSSTIGTSAAGPPSFMCPSFMGPSFMCPSFM